MRNGRDRLPGERTWPMALGVGVQRFTELQFGLGGQRMRKALGSDGDWAEKINGAVEVRGQSGRWRK